MRVSQCFYLIHSIFLHIYIRGKSYNLMNFRYICGIINYLYGKSKFQF